MDNGLRFDPRDQDGLWVHMLKKSPVRLGTRVEYQRRAETISSIKERVEVGAFSPNNLGFLCSAKGNGIPRFIPVLDVETTCVFFACIKAVDETCASLAVPGTYGGWSLGGKRRDMEEEAVVRRLLGDSPSPDDAAPASPQAAETPRAVDTLPPADSESIPDEEDVEIDDGSAPTSPYNKAAWVANWQEYWKAAALAFEDSRWTTVFVSFDIANFYDSIDLVRLRRRLQDKCSEQMHVLDVLEFLSTQWNKSLRFYQPSSKGVPMDMVGDMSRVLANFYLVEYDLVARELAQGVGGQYLRWADDMTFTCESVGEGRALLYRASQKLHEIGLNINTSKVRFRTRDEFEIGWGFRVMDALQDDQRLVEGLERLKGSWETPGYERRDTALRRAITLLRGRTDLEEWRRWAFEKALSMPDFAARLTHGQMNSLVVCSGQEEGYLRDLRQEIMSSPFTEPKAHLLRCLEQRRKNAETFNGELFEETKREMLESSHPILQLAARHTPY